jgi:hypothetical protein
MLGIAGGTDSVFKVLTGTRSDEQGSRKCWMYETVGRCEFIIIIIIIIVIITDIVVMYNISPVSAATSLNRHSLWYALGTYCMVPDWLGVPTHMWRRVRFWWRGSGLSNKYVLDFVIHEATEERFLSLIDQSFLQDIAKSLLV